MTQFLNKLFVEAAFVFGDLSVKAAQTPFPNLLHIKKTPFIVLKVQCDFRET